MIWTVEQGFALDVLIEAAAGCLHNSEETRTRVHAALDTLMPAASKRAPLRASSKDRARLAEFIVAPLAPEADQEPRVVADAAMAVLDRAAELLRGPAEWLVPHQDHSDIVDRDEFQLARSRLVVSIYELRKQHGDLVRYSDPSDRKDELSAFVEQVELCIAAAWPLVCASDTVWTRCPADVQRWKRDVYELRVRMERYRRYDFRSRGVRW